MVLFISVLVLLISVLVLFISVLVLLISVISFINLCSWSYIFIFLSVLDYFASLQLLFIMYPQVYLQRMRFRDSTNFLSFLTCFPPNHFRTKSSKVYWPFLKRSARNVHKLKDLVFSIPSRYREQTSIIKTITNVLFSFISRIRIIVLISAKISLSNQLPYWVKSAIQLITYIYILLVCLFVCCTVKTAELIRLNIFVEPQRKISNICLQQNSIL